MKQLLGVAQQETVGCGVELVYLLFDAAEQAQLVQVAQGEVGTLIEFPLTGALLDGIAEDIAQCGLCEREDEVATRMTLGAPFLGVAQTVGHTGILDAGVEDALLQLEEEACDASTLVGEVVDG